MKQLYEIKLDVNRKIQVRVCNSVSYSLLDSEVVKLDEFHYISYNKSELTKLKPVLENAYKKKKFMNIIRNYFQRNHITFMEEESNAGSVYFKFTLPTFDKTITVRLSDHQPNKVCASLAIRYDKYSITNRNLVSHIEGMLDKLVRRKSVENLNKGQNI